MLEACATLGFLVAQTTQGRLGAMVTAVTFRPPALLIKAVTTLDVLSDGRVWLGIGSGYHEEEARALDSTCHPLSFANSASTSCGDFRATCDRPDPHGDQWASGLSWRGLGDRKEEDEGVASQSARS